jgi:hypothetical protein
VSAGAETAQKVEDETYLQNTLRDLKLAKALDLMDQVGFAYKHARKALFTMEQLVNLRKEQGRDSYSVLLAPLHYKIGDFLATYVELNTDEFGNVKPLPDECQDSESEAEEDDELEEVKEEVSHDSQPVIKEVEEPCQINTFSEPAKPTKENEEGEEANAGEELI